MKKKIFFRQPTAKYDEIHSGKLKLIPDENLFDEVKLDYKRLKEMIFGEYPDFEVLIGELKELENKINLSI